MIIASEEDFLGIKRIGWIVAIALQRMLKAVRPGLSTAQLDTKGKEILDYFGAVSAPNRDYQFPGCNCISINDEAAHGIPGPRVIEKGDLVNIDVSAELDGYYADNGATVMVPPVTPQARDICLCSQRALAKAISAISPGVRLNELGRVIHQEAKESGFSVIRNLSGHGVGLSLHEKPHFILNYYEPINRGRLKEGMVLAVETFISSGGSFAIKDKDDGWTLRTNNGALLAQYEHTVIVGKDKPIIVTGGGKVPVSYHFNSENLKKYGGKHFGWR